MEKKRRLVKFSIFHNSKFMAVLYFIISIPFAAIFGVIGMLAPNDKAPFPGWLAICLPFGYAIAGFIFCMIGFAIYNWVASLMSGGLEFTVEEE